jgi:hypothetical protein
MKNEEERKSRVDLLLIAREASSSYKFRMKSEKIATDKADSKQQARKLYSFFSTRVVRVRRVRATLTIFQYHTEII